MEPSIIFPVIAAAVSLGGVLIAVGVLKGKVTHAAEINQAQEEHLKALASKDALAAAIARSDELLDIMRQRAEEDRAKGQGQWREFHNILSKHAERIGVLENQQTILMKSLDEIKVDLKSGFRQLQDEINKIRVPR